MIKSVWVEIRPALRCCYVCVTFKEDINSGVKLKIKKSNLAVEVEGKSFTVNFHDFVVEPLTMTDFKATKRFLYFRIQTECDFKCRSIPPPKSKPPSLPKQKSSLNCQCHNPLTDKVLFDRILPLPSNEFNPSDLFCQLPATSLPSPTPKPNDCLYSDHVIVINDKAVKGCLTKGKFLKCKRCLVGVGVCDGHSVRLWISSLRLPDNLTWLERFKLILWKAVSDPFSMFPKLLLECEESQTYLSIVVVDKNLVVSSCQQNLELRSDQVVKLKYKFHSCCDDLVKALRDELFHSLHVQVHKSLLDVGVHFLVSSSKSIPPVFSKVDNDCMTYLNLSDCF